MSSVAHFSLEHYEHLAELGAFDGEFQRRVELIRGEILDMSPIGSDYAEIVNRLVEWSFESLAGRSYRVRAQDPIRLPHSESEPQSDLAWVSQKDYSRRHPEPQDITLIVEVAETSLGFDRGEKAILYASAGIPEYWIVNLIDKQIEVYRDASGNTYQLHSIHRGNETISPLAAPTAKLAPARLFE